MGALLWMCVNIYILGIETSCLLCSCVKDIIGNVRAGKNESCLCCAMERITW